jgi:hypothetical protein
MATNIDASIAHRLFDAFRIGAGIDLAHDLHYRIVLRALMAASSTASCRPGLSRTSSTKAGSRPAMMQMSRCQRGLSQPENQKSAKNRSLVEQKTL